MAYFCPLSRFQEKCIFTPIVLMLNKQRQQASFQTIKSILLQDVEFLKQDTKKKADALSPSHSCSLPCCRRGFLY